MENYNNIINNNEYNAMVYGGQNLQQTNIPLSHHHPHLQAAANSENIINLSYHQRSDPIIAHNLPQSLGLYPTEQMVQQNQQLHLQAQNLLNHQQAIAEQQQQQMYAESRYVPVPEQPPAPISVPAVMEKEPEYHEEPQKEIPQQQEPEPMEDIPEMNTANVIMPTEQSEETPVAQEEEQMEQQQSEPEQQTEKVEEPSEELKKEEEGGETPADNEETTAEQPATAESEEVKEEESETVKPEPKQEEPDVDPNQCRVCTSTEDLLDIFTVEYDMRISDLIMKICTNIRIHERDFLPHLICTGCVGKLKTAYDFKNTCESTDKELRQKLKRSRKSIRKPSDFVLIDCNVFDEDSDDNDEENDDDFKVSDGADDFDSDESFETRKNRKRQPPKKRPIKKSKQKGKGKSRSAPARSSSTPAPASKTPARNSRSTAKTSATTTTSNKKKPEPSKPDLTSTSKRLKRDIVYIEATYESSDEEVISAKKKRTSGSAAKVQEPPAKGGANITSSDDKAKHICKECNIECSSKKALGKHRAASHFQPGEDAPFRCLICNRGFKYNINLTSHMQIHKENYTCDCGKSFSNKGDLKKHTNSEHKNDNSITYECSKCKRFFSSLTRYEKHRESCTSVPSSQKTIKISAPAVKKPMVEKRVREEAAAAAPSSGKDLFKTVAPLTTTYWSDSFSD